jgi:hypothetical protein
MIMRESLMFLAILIAMFVTPTAQAQCNCEPLESLGVSLGVGTLGVGLEASSSLTPYIAARVGLDALLYTYNYTYTGTSSSGATAFDYEVPLKAKANLLNGHILVDLFPIPDYIPIHLTVGTFFGAPKLIKVTGTLESDQEIVIGNMTISPSDYLGEEDGKVEAALKTSSFKPYVGLGYGRTIPYSRLGYKVELGAMYHGSPTIKVLSGESVGEAADNQVDGFNKFIKDFSVYPVFKLQLIYRFY